MIMFRGGAAARRLRRRPDARPGTAACRRGSDPPATEQLIADGWGYALLTPSSIQADNGAGLTKGIIGLVNKGQPRKPDDWGSLRAWSWGAARALDYLETDQTVDASAGRHRRGLALRQGRAGHDGLRAALCRGAGRIVGRRRRQASSPQLRRGRREPHRPRRISLDGRKFPEVRRRGIDVRTQATPATSPSTRIS